MADEQDPNQTVDESVRATYAGSGAPDDLEDRITDERDDSHNLVRQVAARVVELGGARAPASPHTTQPGWPEIEASRSRADETPLGHTHPMASEQSSASSAAAASAAEATHDTVVGALSSDTPGGATMLHVPSDTPLREGELGADDSRATATAWPAEPPPQLSGAIDSPMPAPREHVSDHEVTDGDDDATGERRKKVPSVQLSPLEAAAAAELAEREAARLADEPVTQVIAKPRARPLRRECRFCGTRVAEPQPTRLSRPEDQGYLCDTCNNVYCGEHVVRTTGVIRSLLSGARYRCVLCVDPDSV
ncbi:MAG: hypothetical protein KC503_25325 [Myxococcales bacterium]|nr:hypothetical protein [Myxococcales bacterium]